MDELKKAENLLKMLLEHFFVSDRGLEWSYTGDTTIGDLLGMDLEMAMVPYLSDKQAAELRETKDHAKSTLDRVGRSDLEAYRAGCVGRAEAADPSGQG